MLVWLSGVGTKPANPTQQYRSGHGVSAPAAAPPCAPCVLHAHECHSLAGCTAALLRRHSCITHGHTHLMSSMNCWQLMWNCTSSATAQPPSRPGHCCCSSSAAGTSCPAMMAPRTAWRVASVADMASTSSPSLQQQQQQEQEVAPGVMTGMTRCSTER
jgi:hypothetical protein